MEATLRRPGVPAEDLVPLLRVHADRVHDAVRRMGVDAATAVDVVEASALALVDTVADRPQDVRDAVGWWFAEARRVARGARARRTDLPLGGGLLATDEDQVVLAEALDELPEEDRLAVLVRDAYRLPWSVVAGALEVDDERAAQIVGRARVRAVPLLDDEAGPALPSHAGDLGALARLGEQDVVAPRDATTSRHLKACQACADVAASQGRVSLLMTGLAVVAMPSEAREVLLDHVEGEAARRLPAAAALELTEQEWDDWEDEQRLLSPLLAVVGVLLAVLLGVGIGVLLSRGTAAVLPAASEAIPAAVPPPVQTPAPLQVGSGLPPPPPIPAPRTTVFVVPSPTPQPPVAPTEPTTAPQPAPDPGVSAPAVQLDPASGPNGANVRVIGTGWQPGARVTVDYLDGAGRPSGSRATATVDDAGRFSTSLVARDPTGLPGRHEVRASAGGVTRSAFYEATA